MGPTNFSTSATIYSSTTCRTSMRWLATYQNARMYVRDYIHNIVWDRFFIWDQLTRACVIYVFLCKDFDGVGVLHKCVCVCMCGDVSWPPRQLKEFCEQTDFETQKPTISWIAEEVLLKIPRISCARYAWKTVLYECLCLVCVREYKRIIII